MQRPVSHSARAIFGALLAVAMIVLAWAGTSAGDDTVSTEDAVTEPTPTTVAAPPVTEAPAPVAPPVTEPAPVPEPAPEPAPAPAVVPPPAATASAPAESAALPVEGSAPATGAPESHAGVGEVDIPLKSSQVGTSYLDYLDEEKCEGVELDPGEVLWHLVMGPIDSSVANPTASLDGPAPFGPSLAPDALQGTNFDWTVTGTATTVPAGVHAATNAPKLNPSSGEVQTELRVSHTCAGEEVVEQTGDLQIVKVETGPNAPGTPGTYTISYDGPGTADGQVQVTAGTPVTVTDLPVGSYTLDEVNPPVGAHVTIAPNPINVPDNATATVTVTNDYPSTETLGSLSFVKVETGATAPEEPGTYTIAYDGPGAADGEVQVTAGEPPVVVDNLPTGSYDISEVDPPSQATVTISPNPAVVGAGQTVEVTVTNAYPTVEDTVIDRPDGGETTPGGGGGATSVSRANLASGTSGTLPRTGGARTVPLLVLGGALLIVGTALVISRRLVAP